MSTDTIDKFDTCPACDSTNIYEDDEVWYCNMCSEVWEGE